MQRRLLTVIVSMLAIAPLGCGEAPTTPADARADADARAATTWLLDHAPSDALPVAEAKAEAAEGQRIAVRGRVGGSVRPISEQSPVFLIVDTAVKHCGQLHGDACTTPWDYCCEPQENLTANSATVQVVDAAGQPIAQDLHDAGLAPLDEVVVVGDVGPRPDPAVLTIRATGVHRLATQAATQPTPGQ